MNRSISDFAAGHLSATLVCTHCESDRKGGAPGRQEICHWASEGPWMLKGLVQVRCAQASEAGVLARRVEQANRALLLQMKDFLRQGSAACRHMSHFLP